MADYRNPNDPFYHDQPGTRRDPEARSYNAMWGWIAGALFLAIILAIAFGVGREPRQTASNDVSPPAPVQTAPVQTMPPAATPNPATPAPAPVQPAPTAPGAQ